MTTPSTVYLVRLKNGRQEQVSWNSWLFVCRVGLPESFSRILEPRNYPSELKAEEARLCASRLRDYLGKCKLMEEEVGELCLPFDPEFIKIIQAQPHEEEWLWYFGDYFERIADFFSTGSDIGIYSENVQLAYLQHKIEKQGNFPKGPVLFGNISRELQEEGAALLQSMCGGEIDDIIQEIRDLDLREFVILGKQEDLNEELKRREALD